MDLISVNKNPTTVMLTWDAATNVHCAMGKVVCKRSCHGASQAATELERDLRFSSVTNRVATLNVINIKVRTKVWAGTTKIL
jgi:hypothetical protein